MSEATNRHLMLLRPGALGDTLLLAPALIALRDGGDWEVALAAQPEAARLLLSAGLVDHAFSFDDVRLSWLFNPSQPGASPYLLPGWRPHCCVAWLADSDNIVSSNLERLAPGHVMVRPSQPERRRHVAHHLAQSLMDAGLLAALPDLMKAVLTLDLTDQQARAGCSPAGQRPLVIHPGSGSARKNWPASLFAELAKGLAPSQQVVVVGGPADEQAVGVMHAALGGSVTFCSGLSLLQLAKLLCSATAFVGNDSGVSHLAGLLGLPAFVLFGPTDPERWRPCGPAVEVIPFSPGEPQLALRPLRQRLQPLLGLG